MNAYVDKPLLQYAISTAVLFLKEQIGDVLHV